MNQTNLIHSWEGLSREVIQFQINVSNELLGYTINIQKLEHNDTTEYYGQYAGIGELKRSVRADVLFDQNPFSVADPRVAASDDAGFVWIVGEVNVGNIITVSRSDGKKRRFNIVSAEALGISEEIVRKFKVSALGD